MNQNKSDMRIDERNNTVAKSNATMMVGKTPRKIEQQLNREGETHILTKEGKEYTTITKVVVEEDKTRVYYKSNYLVFGGPQYIIDNQTGEKILPTDDFKYMYLEDWRFLDETNESMAIYFDEAFKINIKGQ